MATFLAQDRVILEGLKNYAARFKAGREPVEWARIMDVCRVRDSQAGMRRLVVLALAERRQRKDTHTPLPRSRPSYEYRITAAGVALLAQQGQTP